MASKAQTIRIGLFTLTALVLLGIVLVVFGGLRMWEDTDHYRVVFTRSVYGLEPGARVYISGVRVGSVEAVDILPDDIRSVAVAIEVDRGTPIRADTRAVLQGAGLTGLKVIDLRDGTSAAPALPPGSQIAAGESLLDKLETQAQALIDESTTLLRRAGALTDRMTDVVEPAQRAADNLARMSATLVAMVDENRAALRGSLAAIERAATGASKLLDGQVAQLFGNADELVAGLRKIVGDNEAALRGAVSDLRQASRSFKELARDVRQKPSRLLFSGSPSDRKLP